MDSKRFLAAGRFLNIVFSVVLFGVVSSILLIGGLALAQDVAVVTPAAPADTATSILGWVFKAILGLTIAGFGWVAVKISQLLQAKTEQTGMTSAQTLAWSLVNKVWLKAQAVGSKLLAKEKDLLDKILSDGVVTADEFRTFQSAIAADLRDMATTEIPMLAGLIGGAGPVGSIIEGFAAKVAHNLLTGKATDPTQSPLGTPVQPAAAPSSP